MQEFLLVLLLMKSLYSCRISDVPMKHTCGISDAIMCTGKDANENIYPSRSAGTGKFLLLFFLVSGHVERAIGNVYSEVETGMDDRTV